MGLYYNEEAAADMESMGFQPGIPNRFEDLIDEVAECETVPVEGEGNGLIRNMGDGRRYALLERREAPFPEYRMEMGVYSEAEAQLEEAVYIEIEHLQDLARVMRVDESESPHTLLDMRQMMLDEGWRSEVKDVTGIDLRNYRPFH